MRRQVIKTVKTSFGTELGQLNNLVGKFKVKENVTVAIDSPLQDVQGTTKTFLKDSIVEGNLWMEMSRGNKKQRRVVMVQDENGRYLIPKKALTPITDSEIQSTSQIKELESKVENILEEVKNEAKSLTSEPSDFLEKKYAGFTGKQILVGAIGVIILVKLFK